MSDVSPSQRSHVDENSGSGELELRSGGEIGVAVRQRPRLYLAIFKFVRRSSHTALQV